MRRAGFTLIELMAVVALIAMVTVLGLPRLAPARWRALSNAADDVAASLEFARQRAVMTGVPHRVLIKLEDGDWRVEWLDDGKAEEETSLAAALANAKNAGAGSSGDGNDPHAPIELHPPVDDALDYRPIPSKLGAFTRLDESLYFVRLEGPSGTLEGGDAQVVFDADGTTEHALLSLADADDRVLVLEIEPVLERIRIREGKDSS